jgi:hypothetical protein
LTAWGQEQIPVTLITDSMAGYFLHQKNVDLVIVGPTGSPPMVMLPIRLEPTPQF